MLSMNSFDVHTRRHTQLTDYQDVTVFGIGTIQEVFQSWSTFCSLRKSKYRSCRTPHSWLTQVFCTLGLIPSGPTALLVYSSPNCSPYLVSCNSSSCGEGERRGRCRAVRPFLIHGLLLGKERAVFPEIIFSTLKLKKSIIQWLSLSMSFPYD